MFANLIPAGSWRRWIWIGLVGALGLLLLTTAVGLLRPIWSRPPKPETPVAEVVKPKQARVDQEATKRYKLLYDGEKAKNEKLQRDLAASIQQKEAAAMLPLAHALKGDDYVLARYVAGLLRPGEFARLRAAQPR